MILVRPRVAKPRPMFASGLRSVVAAATACIGAIVGARGRPAATLSAPDGAVAGST